MMIKCCQVFNVFEIFEMLDERKVMNGLSSICLWMNGLSSSDKC